MSVASDRIALVRSLAMGRGLRISDVSHSVGSTINIGAGKVTPSRYSKSKRGTRRPGYYRAALFELFLSSANWEITGRTGYRLHWSNDARRIAKETPRLMRSEIQTVEAPRFGDRIRVGFRNGIILTVYPDDDEEDAGWVLFLRHRPFSLGVSE